MKIKLILFTVFLSFASAAKNNEVWIDVTHSLDCKKFAYVGKDGKCYIGPNSELMEYFYSFEKEAYAMRWLWNHGKSKEFLRKEDYYKRYFTDRNL